jgi:hypothetical protein
MASVAFDIAIEDIHLQPKNNILGLTKREA